MVTSFNVPHVVAEMVDPSVATVKSVLEGIFEAKVIDVDPTIGEAVVATEEVIKSFHRVI
jgi:hypothetical protein